MKRSDHRILTTHTGSLPRPADLLELMGQREHGTATNEAAIDERIRTAVEEVVAKQAAAGIDIVSDGELGKPGFFHYVGQRLNGMEGRVERFAGGGVGIFADFPDYAAFQAKRMGMLAGGASYPEVVGPLSWKDRGLLQAEIDNFKAALAKVNVEEAFLPAASIGIIAQRIANKHYPTYEEYVYALAEVMSEEYHAIAEAGLIVQIDAPEMVMDKHSPAYIDKPLSEYRKRMELWVEALNSALKGIPEEQVRFHICWGNQEGPHTLDVPLADVADIMLKVNAEAYSVEASNPRHAHEWKIWQDVKLPDGKILIPGVIDSTTNFVEHPELVADRICNYANIVGRENVIAGTDCGFGTLAFRTPLVFEPVMWAKFEAMAEGARIATRRLWG